ncbi:hypothetical protein AB6D60_22405 [Vibrio splendidus]
MKIASVIDIESAASLEDDYIKEQLDYLQDKKIHRVLVYSRNVNVNFLKEVSDHIMRSYSISPILAISPLLWEASALAAYLSSVYAKFGKKLCINLICGSDNSNENKYEQLEKFYNDVNDELANEGIDIKELVLDIYLAGNSPDAVVISERYKLKHLVYPTKEHICRTENDTMQASFGLNVCMLDKGELWNDVCSEIKGERKSLLYRKMSIARSNSKWLNDINEQEDSYGYSTILFQKGMSNAPTVYGTKEELKERFDKLKSGGLKDLILHGSFNNKQLANVISLLENQEY